MEIIHRRKTCRLCASPDLAMAFALTPTPPANSFVGKEVLADHQRVFPLDVHFCNSCTHLQLLDVVDPQSLFKDYVYVSGTSPSFVKHFQNYASHVADRVKLQPGDLVVDIGSNDGTLLEAFKGLGAKVLGIDPARDIAATATSRGIETWPEFFDLALAHRIMAHAGSASIVTANNVFAHIDDLSGFLNGVRSLLTVDGVFVFEVSYLLDVVQKVLFDTIYHEHLDYHAVGPLVPFFRKHGLELIEVTRVPTHGGSLRGIARRSDGPHEIGLSIGRALEEERDAQLQRIETYEALSEKIGHLAVELRSLLSSLKQQGKTIAGFGAPAKATTLMYHFGLDRDIIDYIVDDSPMKQGLFTPGLHVPVLSRSALTERMPDYVVILAWNFAEQIIANNAAFRNAGGRFIVPLPKLEIV